MRFKTIYFFSATMVMVVTFLACIANNSEANWSKLSISEISQIKGSGQSVECSTHIKCDDGESVACAVDIPPTFPPEPDCIGYSIISSYESYCTEPSTSGLSCREESAPCYTLNICDFDENNECGFYSQTYGLPTTICIMGD